MLSRALALPLLLAAACGGKVVVDPTPSSGAGGATSACGKDGMPIPAVYKACTADSECTIDFVYVDCCGAQRVVGVAVSQVAFFEGYIHTCNNIVPACACDPALGQTDDGSETVDGADIQVVCDDGQCLTEVQ